MEYKILYNLYYQDKTEYEKIYAERFNSETAIHLDYLINGQRAFLYLHPAHYALIDTINKYDKKLAFVTKELPTAALEQFVRDTLITEIKTTNDIEGVISTRQEIKAILDQLANKKHERLYGMVNRYNFLMGQKNFELSTPADIRKIYDDLVGEEVKQNDSKDQPDGTIFRSDNVFLYKAGGSLLHKGVYPEKEIISDISKALNIVNNEELIDLVRISVFHYLFGYIHPFYNGNGRVSRFISSYLLSKNYTPLIAYRLSQQIKSQKKMYYDAFEKTNDPKNKGDLGCFVYYFLSIIKEMMKSTYDLLQGKLDQLKHYYELLEGCSLPEKEKELIFLLIQSSLFSDDGFTIDELVAVYDQAKISVRKKLSILKEKNLLNISRQGHALLYRANMQEVEKIKCD